MKKKPRFILSYLVVLLLVSACGDNSALINSLQETAVVQTLTAMAPTETATPLPTPTATETPIPSPTRVDTSVGPDNFPEGVNPLTGLKVANPVLLQRRPVLIKVANYPTIGRPHAGLSYADIVWDYYIGEGANRFIALYYGQDCAQVGPIRSARFVDPEITTMYQGVLAFSGANIENVYPTTQKILGNRMLTESNPPGVYREDWTVVGVFGDSAAITQMMRDRAADISDPDLTGMLFDSYVPEGGETAQKASLHFNYLNKADWVYDPESGKYLRWIENPKNYDEMLPLVDRLTDEQLAFSNVIMVYVTYTAYNSLLDKIGVYDHEEGQKAVVFRDGQAYEVTWKTKDSEKPMQFFDKEGNLFPLKPGNSWINLIGTSSSMEEEDGAWLFTFSRP